MSTTTTIDRPAPPRARATQAQPEAREQVRRRPGARRWRVIGGAILAAIAVLFAGILYAWTRIDAAEASANQRLERERAASGVAMARVAAATDQVIAARDKQLQQLTGRLLRLSAVPLAWAVRDALDRQDFGRISTYVRDLAREPAVRRVALALPDGKVRVASDPNLEGQDASAAFGGVSLAAEAPSVETTAHETLVLVPVMGMTNRLGTVIVATDRHLAAR